MPNQYYIIAHESLSDLDAAKQVILASYPVGNYRALHRLRGATLHQAKTSVRNIPVGVDVGDHIYATTDDSCSNIVAISDVCYQLGRRHFKYRAAQVSDSQYHLLVRMPLCRVSDTMKYEYVVGIPLGLLPPASWQRAFTAYRESRESPSMSAAFVFAQTATEEQWLFDIAGDRLL